MRARLLSTLIAFATPAYSAEPAYLDDRSTAEALIRSLYNAVNRKEYSRAYSYFAAPPAPTPEAYAAGYADTARVELLTGPESEEGAAGSIFFRVPVALRAEALDGNSRIFAGCYTIRLANPQVQDGPFVPMAIEKGELRASSDPFTQAVPSSCGDGPPPPARDTSLDKAAALFRASFADQCESLSPTADPDATDPESYTIRFRYSTLSENDPETATRLFRFFCGMGAYNEAHVYLFEDALGEIRVLNFATPDLDIRYENNDSEGAVEAIYVSGFKSTPTLINSYYAAETLSIHAYAKWRGVGDASSSGKWIFREGDFVLVRYEVDASYDQEINPEVVVDYDSGP